MYFAVEAERLLREHPTNQDLLRSIGAEYYQIVNVVQIRHHQVMGLSTRESTSKGPRSQNQGIQAMQQSRVRIQSCTDSGPGMYLLTMQATTKVYAHVKAV